MISKYIIHSKAMVYLPPHSDGQLVNAPCVEAAFGMRAGCDFGVDRQFQAAQVLNWRQGESGKGHGDMGPIQPSYSRHGVHS